MIRQLRRANEGKELSTKLLYTHPVIFKWVETLKMAEYMWNIYILVAESMPLDFLSSNLSVALINHATCRELLFPSDV